MFTYAEVVAGRSGSYVPGLSAAYENQALPTSPKKVNFIFAKNDLTIT